MDVYANRVTVTRDKLPGGLPSGSERRTLPDGKSRGGSSPGKAKTQSMESDYADFIFSKGEASRGIFTRGETRDKS